MKSQSQQKTEFLTYVCQSQQEEEGAGTKKHSQQIEEKYAAALLDIHEVFIHLENCVWFWVPQLQNTEELKSPVDSCFDVQRYAQKTEFVLTGKKEGQGGT